MTASVSVSGLAVWLWLFPGGIVNQTRQTFFYSSRSFQKQNWIDWMMAVRWRMVDTCDLIDFKAHYLFLPLELKCKNRPSWTTYYKTVFPRVYPFLSVELGLTNVNTSYFFWSSKIIHGKMTKQRECICKLHSQMWRVIFHTLIILSLSCSSSPSSCSVLFLRQHFTWLFDDTLDSATDSD